MTDERTVLSTPPELVVHSTVGPVEVRAPLGDVVAQSSVGSAILETTVGQPATQVALGAAAVATSTGAASTAAFSHRGPWTTATAYSVNDLVTAYGSLWRCVTAHTSTGDHIDESKFVRMDGFAPPRVGSAVLVGHSYVDTGPVTEGTSGRGFFAARMMQALGLGPHQLTNLAVSGSTARWHAYLTLQGYNPGALTARTLQAKTGVGIVWYGGNDAIQGYADDTWQEWTFKRGYHAIISRLRCGAFFENDHASVAYTGTWTQKDFLDDWNVNMGSGETYRRSTTVGDKITITTHDTVGAHKDGVWIQLQFLGAKSGAAASVKLDGVQIGSLDVGRGASFGTAFGESADTFLTPYVFRFWLPTTHTTGTHNYTQRHTIEVTITGGVNTNGLLFDGWGVEADDPPPVFCLSTVSPSNARSIWATLANPAVIAKYNLWSQEVIAEFTDSTGADQDPLVRYVDVNYVIGGYESMWSQFSNEKYFTGDGLHPNEVGGQLIAEAVLSEINASLHLGVPARNFLGYSDFERDPMWQTPQLHESTVGTPLTTVDDFDRPPSETDIGGSGWTSESGAWGVDRYGQAQLVDSCWFEPWDFRDDFDRADSSSLGDVDYARTGTPPSWVEGKGAWSISSGQLTMTSAAGGSGLYPHCVFDVGSNVHWVEAQMTSVTSNLDVGVIVRYVDGNNFIFFTYNLFGVGLLYKVVAGVATNVASGSAFSNPHVEVNSSHEVRVYNGRGSTATITYTITDAALQAAGASKVGVWGNATTGIAYDDVKAGLTLSHNATLVKRNWLLRTVGSADGVTGVTVGDDGTGIPVYFGFTWRWVDEDNHMLAMYDSAVFNAWVVQKIVAGVAVDTFVYWTDARAGDEIAVENRGTSVVFYKNGEAKPELFSGLTTETETGAALSSTTAGLQFPWSAGEPTPRWRAFLWGYEMAESVLRGDILFDRSDPHSVTAFGFFDQLGAGWGAGVPITPTAVEAHFTYRAVAADDNIVDTDGVVGVTGTTTVTLPAVASRTGTRFVIKNIGAGAVTVEGDGAETIDGAANVALAAGNSVTVVSTGAEWIAI